MPRVTGIHHVAITVAIIERSVAWYRKVRSFSSVLSAEHADGTERNATMTNPESSVVFSPRVLPDSKVESLTETHAGRDNVGLAVEVQSSLEEWERHLTELNVEHSPFTYHLLDGQSGYAVVAIREPDNVQLELEFFCKA